MTGVALQIDPAALQPVIEAAVVATIAKLTRLDAGGDKLAYREGDAAALCGLAKHQLRDSRLRGELKASKVGKVILYTRVELQKFLAARNLNP